MIFLPVTPITEAGLQQILQAGHPRVYSLLVGVGGLLGLRLIWVDSRAWHLSMKHRIGLIATVLVGGLLGSGIPEHSAGGLIQHQVQQCAVTPKTILAGLLFGFFGAVLYKKVLHLQAQTSDAFARGTCLMMAIGKLGCYAAHCCFGIATSGFFGQDFGDGVARFPVQIVESAALFLLFGWLNFLQRRACYPDRRLFIFFGCYGLLRFGSEFLRQPIAGAAAGLGFYQWFAFGLVALGLYQVIKRTPLQTHAPAVASSEQGS